MCYCIGILTCGIFYCVPPFGEWTSYGIRPLEWRGLSVTKRGIRNFCVIIYSGIYISSRGRDREE